jgi:hypothetical protein
MLQMQHLTSFFLKFKSNLLVKISRHTINIFLFLHILHWRWPYEWPKHVGGHYVVTLHS